MKVIHIGPMLALTLATIACGHNPTGPSEAPAPQVIQYAINVPTVALQQQFNGEYPNGVSMPPIQAQNIWDFRDAFGGAPNVYFGPTAPSFGSYNGIGIVVAPVAAASKQTWTAADWPAIGAGTWLGRFAVANYKPF